MTSCRGAGVAARRNDVIDVAPARRRGRAVAQPRRPRAGGRRRVAKSPMTSVASRGFEVGADPAGSFDLLPSRRVRARREQTTVSDRRGGLAAASLSQPRRHQRGRATGCSPGGGRAGTVAVGGDMRRRCCRSVGRWRGEQRPAVCVTGGGGKTSLTAWAGGTTSWRQRTAS